MSTRSFIPTSSYQEDRFFRVWRWQKIPYDLIRQYKIGPYYADFAHPESGVIIEIDGAAYHSTTEQVERDHRRQEELEARGWKVIRFAGKEVHRFPVRCVLEAKDVIAHNLSL